MCFFTPLNNLFLFHFLSLNLFPCYLVILCPSETGNQRKSIAQQNEREEGNMKEKLTREERKPSIEVDGNQKTSNKVKRNQREKEIPPDTPGFAPFSS